MNGFVDRNHAISKVLLGERHCLTPSEAVLGQENHLCLILPQLHGFKLVDR